MDDSLWHILQTTDSAFPVGGFAHSYGFEGMVQANLITTPDDVDEFLTRNWIPLLTHVDFPLVRLSRQAAESDEAIYRLDQLAWACRPTSESRHAQQQMGRQRLKLMAEIRRHPRLTKLAQAVENNEWMANWPVVWGVESHCLNIALDFSLISYGYQSINGIMAASMKLIRIGPTEVQRIMSRHGARLSEAVKLSEQINEDEIGWFSPLLDICGANHEVAYSRLFIS